MIPVAMCAIAALATVGVAYSQIGAQKEKMGRAIHFKHEQILTVDVRSEAAAKRLVTYLKSSHASYYLEQGSKGKSSKLSSGSVSMGDLKIIREKMPKWRTPGNGGDGPIATNANNGEFADAGHVAMIVWGANDTGILKNLGSVLQRVDKGLFRVDAFEKGVGKGILGKKLGSIGAGGLKTH